jgi:hypothetical protein
MESYSGPKILVYFDSENNKFVELMGKDAEDYIKKNGQSIGFTNE